ncbi:MAG TPA: DUF1572 family protein [Pirellulales bacterium]|jgi:hypothetical protein
MANSEQLGIEFLREARREMADCRRKIEHCVEQLSEEQLWWRPNEATNSIANLLLHLAGNIGQRIGSGVGGQPYDRDRDREFAERGPIGKVELRARLDRSIALADRVLAGLADEQLLEARRYRMLRGDVEASVLRLIVQTLVHLGGHTQEIIAMTRRQLGDAYRFMQPPAIPAAH